MTVETTNFIDFGDIAGVEFQCGTCGAKVTFTVAGSKFLVSCPLCGSEWLDTDTQEAEAIRTLVNSLRKAAETLKGRRFSLRLQVPVLPGLKRDSDA
jgi:DNA-directed RNA polymerase subunit RPC12/RpoP